MAQKRAVCSNLQGLESDMSYDDTLNDDSDLDGDTSEEEVQIDSESSDSETDIGEEGNSSDEEEGGASFSQGVWCNIVGDDIQPHSVPFTGVPGPRRMPAPTSNPIEYLNLFFTDKFIDAIVKETNAYARLFIDNNAEYLARHPRSRIHTSWIQKGNTTREEFRGFLGILIAMGLVEKPSLESYWDTCHSVIDTPFFYEHFNRDRFMMLLKFMHFNNNAGAPSDNIFHKIQPVVSHFFDVFKKYFVP